MFYFSKKEFRFRKVISGLIFGFVFLNVCFSQESFDFAGKDINEILYAVSLARNISICGDDTVSGKADFRWVGDDFDEAFDSFLLKNRLYVRKTEKKWTVSRIRFERKDDSFSLDCFDVLPARIFEECASAGGICVTAESLPSVKLSLHTGFCGAEELVKRIAGGLSGFSVEKNGDGSFSVVRSGVKDIKRGLCELKLNEDFSVSISLQGCSFCEAVEKLFCVSGNDFCIDGNDVKLGRADFTAENVDEALRILCLMALYEVREKNGIYYLSQGKGSSKIKEEGREWRSCRLKYGRAGEIISLCNKRFPEIETFSTGNGGNFFYLADEEEALRLEAFVGGADIEEFSKLVQLKYIRTGEFLANLPPFVDKSQITDTGRGDSFYFTGSEEAYERLYGRLPEIDRPVSRVKYDLLIMQYQSTAGKSWNPVFKAGRVSLGDMNTVSGSLGSVLDLSLDVVSAFGMKFAFDLQTAISESKAKVYADTTLNGVSGSTISFANTNTFRYRDNNLDPETGKPVYSGVTKEIISGLKLEVTGTVTGDGMITSKITASVSRQGTDLSTTTGNPPPTSEKVVTTEVRARSGEPVVLSGLIQNEQSENVSRTPFLSKIPLIGRLFRGNEKDEQKTELVIYLLPSAEIFEGENISKSPKEIQVERKNTLKALVNSFSETKEIETDD